MKECVHNDVDFVPLYIGEIDNYGHLYADNIGMMKPYLINVDAIIQDIYIYYEQHCKDYSIMVLGDHGMVPVKEKVDISASVKAIPLKYGKDYEMFLDSTVARFWFKKEGSEAIIFSVLEKQFRDKGFILSKKDCAELHVPYGVQNESGTKLYGDMIWCANPGVIISPDYFNRGKELRGMHGYAHNNRYSNGLAVLVSNIVMHGRKESCELVDICPTICDLMGVRYPVGCSGKSIIKY